MSCGGKLKAYDAISLFGASKGKVDGGVVAPVYVLCPLCEDRVRKTPKLARNAKRVPKLLVRGKGLRDHLNASHASLSKEEQLRTMMEAEETYLIEDKDRFLADFGTSLSPAPSTDMGRVSPRASVQANLDRGLAAARDGDIDTLRTLLETNAWNIQTVDKYGSSALHWAAGSGHLDIVKLLINGVMHTVGEVIDAVKGERRGDTRIQEGQGEVTVAAVAEEGDGEEGVEERENAGGVDGEKKEDSVQHIVKRQRRRSSLDPRMNTLNAKCSRKDGKQPVHWAARNGHILVLEYLIEEHGIDVDTHMNDQSTPLHLAIFGGHMKCVQYLLEKKADLFARNDHLCNAAHWAAMGGSTEVTEFLMARGVPFGVLQKEKQTPLHKAAGKKHFHLLPFIATHIVDAALDNQFDFGETDPPLCADAGNAALSAARAFFGAVDTSGLTALHVAVAQGAQTTDPALRAFSAAVASVAPPKTNTSGTDQKE